MSTLVILNDPPEGSERTQTGLRLAVALSRGEWADVRVFLVGGAALVARSKQEAPQDVQSSENMLRTLLRRGVEVSASGLCLDARGIGEADLVEGVKRSTMEMLSEWVEASTKTLVF